MSDRQYCVTVFRLLVIAGKGNLSYFVVTPNS